MMVCMADHMAMMKADSAAKANEAVCIGCFEKVFAMMSSGDVTGIEECISENMIEHATMPPGITSAGLQGLKDVIAWQIGAFPDMKLPILSAVGRAGPPALHNQGNQNRRHRAGYAPPANETRDEGGGPLSP